MYTWQAISGQGFGSYSSRLHERLPNTSLCYTWSVLFRCLPCSDIPDFGGAFSPGCEARADYPPSYAYLLRFRFFILGIGFRGYFASSSNYNGGGFSGGH